MTDRPNRNVTGALILFATAFMLCLAAVMPVSALEVVLGKRGFIQQFDGGGEEGGKPDQVADFPGGATLPTDSEVDRILKRADEYVRDGRYDLAVVVWQKVLDGSTSVLRSTDGKYYTSVQVYVEDQLDRLAHEAPDGLKEYRLKADGEARELIAQAKGKDEEKALSDVVRRFFYSSLGDDAAYTLGCLMLDRYEFVAATRLFTSIVARHPDYTAKTDTPPNLSRADLWLRLSVAAARSGDARTAKAAVEELTKVGAPAGATEVVSWVRDMIAEGGGAIEVVGTPAGEWTMVFGSPSHDGRMTGLPAETKYTGVWQERWIARFNDQSFGLTGPQGAMGAAPQPMARRISRLPNAAPAAANTGGYDSRRRQLVKKWESSDWIPADNLLMNGGRVYFRAYDRVVCVDGRTGKAIFSSPSRVMPQVRPFQPSSAEEMQLFADRASNSMSINDGVLYYLEEDNSSYIQTNQTFFRSRSGISGFRPQLGNRIVALDARTGKLLWRTEAEADESGNRRPVRYQAAPVPYGTLLLTPVIDNGALWLYARKADKKGEIAWKTFLADDPPGGYQPWATTGLAVAGGDAYLVSGGVVFNVDATGGLVRWATRYQRSLDGSVRVNNYYGQASPSPRGWEEDFIIPVGRTLVVAANDRDGIMSFDRRTGQEMWEIERDGATHVIGTSGKFLFVAGRDRLRKYDMMSGVLSREIVEFEQPITGRGFIAEDAIYLPMGNAIARYHPTTFKRLSIVGVALPINDADGKFDYNDPVGNLFSDGQRLFGVGVERVYSLGTLERKTPAAGDPQHDPEKTGPAAAPSSRKESTGDSNVDVLLDHGIDADSKGLGKFLRDLHPSDESRKHIDTLIRQLGDDDYNKRKDAQKELLAMPVVPIEAISNAMESSTDAEVRDSAARILAATDGKRSRVLFAALTTIRKKEIKGLAAETLAAAPLCTQQYLLDAAGAALKATASEGDADLLKKSLKHAEPEVRIVAAGAIGVLLKEKGQADLKTLADDKDNRVKLASARALADQGERSSLPMLVNLLDAADVQTRSSAIRILRALTGQQHDFIAYDDAEKRKPAVEKWKAWIAAEGKTAKLNFPLAETRMMLGKTLVANYRTARVYELDSAGSETWSLVIQNPWGVQGLPNGHRLVSSYSQRNVIEYDTQGEKIWEQSNLPSAPFSVERLENGNTLIACSNSNRVLEVDSGNKIVWDKTIQGRPTEAKRLPNGRTLVALQNGNRVVEVDEEGKEQWKIDNLGAPISAQRLPNGNTLVAEVSGNRVREFDADGKEVWSLNAAGGRNVQTPYYAERLENGNTLVADQSGIREIDPKGTVVWEKMEQGVTRVSKF